MSDGSEGGGPGQVVDSGRIIDLVRGGHRVLTPDEHEAAKAERDPARAPRNTPLCGARLKDGKGGFTGDTCSQTRGWGTTHAGYGHCKRHGGSTKTGIAHAAEQRARELVAEDKQQLRLFGRRSVITPEDALLGEMQRTHAIVQGIEAQMAEWAQGDYTDTAKSNTSWGEEVEATDEDNGTRFGQTATGLPQLVAVHSTEKAVGFTDTEWAAWIKVLREERKHLVAVANACIGAGIMERRQRMLEANAQFMRKVLEAAMSALGMDSADPRIPGAVQAAILTVVRESTPGMAV